MWFPPVPKFLIKKKLKDQYTSTLVRLIVDHRFSINDLKDMKLSTFLALVEWINKENKEKK